MVCIALYDKSSAGRFELDDILSAILFTRDDYSLTVYSDFSELSEDLTKNGRYFDLLFADITAQSSDGTAAADFVRRNNPGTEIVLISDGYADFRIGYGMKAIDYLVKPITRQQMEKTIDVFYSYLLKQERVFTYKSGTTLEKLPLQNIRYFFSKGRKVSIVSRTGETPEFYGKLDEVESSPTL